jgi:hypothetical protein
MQSGCDGTFTCLYEDDTRVDFDILTDEHFFAFQSQPIVDIHHQPDLVEKKGAWEVIHDKLYIVSRKGEVITIDASVVDGYNPTLFFDDIGKVIREEAGLKRPEMWQYTSFDPAPGTPDTPSTPYCSSCSDEDEIRVPPVELQKDE